MKKKKAAYSALAMAVALATIKKLRDNPEQVPDEADQAALQPLPQLLRPHVSSPDWFWIEIALDHLPHLRWNSEGFRDDIKRVVEEKIIPLLERLGAKSP